MRKKLVMLQTLGILFAVFQYGMRAAGQEEGGHSNKILSSIFHPSLIARMPLAGSGVDEWLTTTGHVNHTRIRVRRRRINQKYPRMPLWRVFPHLIGSLYTYGNRTARAIWCYCSDKVYLYQLMVKSVIFYTLREWCALVNEMLLMMAGDIESNPGPGGELTPDDLSCVLEEVRDTSARWYPLGLQLSVMTGTLDRIRACFSDPRDQLQEMLKTWLITCDSPSWKVLIDALRGVGASQLAEALEMKYCLVDRTEDSDTATSDRWPETDIIPSPGSEPVVTPQSRVADIQEKVLGGGYASYMGGGGGQDLNQIPQMTGPGSGMSVQQPTLPGMTPGQMRMLGSQQHVPMHMVGQQHLKYNPPVYHGPLGFHQQEMVRPQPRLSTMVTHAPPRFANQMARMPFQSTVLPGMTGGSMESVQQPGKPSPATASQPPLLSPLEPTLRNSPETNLSPQQQPRVPSLTTEQVYTKPPLLQLQQTPPQTQILEPQSGHNLPSMSQPSSLQQSQQPAATSTPQTQIQQQQRSRQTQQEQFGSLSMVADPRPPSTAHLPGTQPQTATQPHASPLLRQSDIAANQPVVHVSLKTQPPRQQEDVMGRPAALDGSTTSHNPPAPGRETPDLEKRKQIQQQLVLLLHAHKCQKREQSLSGEYHICDLPHCSTMKNVLNHMTECQAGRSCTYPHCASSRQIISHWKNCMRPDCPVCKPLKHPAADRPAQQRGSTEATNTETSSAVGSGDHEGPSTSRGKEELSTLITFLSTSASMPADFEQAKVSYPVHIVHHPTQQWQFDVNSDLRQHLVRKLIEAIYPVSDPMTLQDKRVSSLVQYAMKVEKAIFETATSRVEYYQLLAEKIIRIRRELEERRRAKNEMGKTRMRLESSSTSGGPGDIETGGTSHSSHPTPVQDTLGYLLAASGDPSVQGLAGDLPQKILESKVESDSTGQVHHLAKWKQWADTNPGVDVFPVEPSHLCQYLTHLIDSDGHEAAIVDVSEAMTWVHSLAGYISPITNPQVDTLLTQLQEIRRQLEVCDHLIRDKETLEFTLTHESYNGRAKEATLLTVDDLGLLKRLIQPVAAYWVAIADQLGMTSLVATIHNTPDNTGPPDFLRDLLYRWLTKGHPTLEELCQALTGNYEIIGGAQVARNLEERFQGQRGVETEMLNSASSRSGAPGDIETGGTSHSSHPPPVQDTLGYLLTASGDPSVQGLARDLPQKILESKVESDPQGHVHHLAKWKQWADTNPGVDVFPVKPSHLCQYLTHLVDSDGHEAAMADVSEAMTWVHSLAGYISPITDRQVDILLTQLQEIRHQLEVCDRLIRDKETLEFTLMQCMFIGLPRAGKSSLMQRLMGEQPLIRTSSTGVVDEAKKVILRPVIESDIESAEYATVQVLGMVWEKLMFDDEAIKFLQDIVRSFHSPSSTSESSSSVPNEQEAESRNDSDTVKEQLESSGSTVIQSQYNQDYAPMDRFKEALKNKKWDVAKQKLEDAWTLYLTDTGGQPEFQEVLPALISGPTVFIVVFNLLTGLDEKFEVKYVRQSGVSSKPYTSAFTLRKALLKMLAGIACTAQCGGNAKSKVLLVGTHKDQVTEEKIREIDEQLQSMLKGTAFYEEGLIEYANRDEHRMLFTVNNLSQDSEETVEIRAAIQKIGGKQKGKQYSFKIKIPATWLAFYLTLRNLEHRVLSYEECFSIARKCGIETRDELDKALFFLHTRLGVVRHFQVDGLRDIVIKDPQLIFDKITELILETFTFADLPGRDRFEREGFFRASFIEVITKDERSELFTSSKLVQLLEHLNIIAPLENHEGELEYFMPCALRQVDPQQASVHSSSSLASLVFKFNCGYCPLGLFSALAVYLTQNKMNSNCSYDWELKQNFVFKNHCEFKVGPYKDVVALTAKDTHFLVSVTPVYTGQRDRSYKLDILCCQVRACIEKGISEASATMHYKCNATYRLGFYCNCAPSYPEDHITIIRNEELGVLECLASDVPCEVLCEHRVWLSQLVQGDSAVVCDQQVSLPQATATLLTVGDLGVLKRLIQPVAAHWVALADQLGMTSLVSTIRSTPDNTGPPAFLRDLLYRWLTKGRPTLEELCQALREDDEIVGGAGVADNLEEWFRGQRGTDMMKQ